MRRDQFNMPKGPYFLSHSAGLMPRAAHEILDADCLEPWRRGDPDIWTKWLSAIDAFRETLAPVIGADAADICPQTNVSSALTKILFSLPVREGRNKIILTEEDFPTVGFVMAQARRLGLEPVFLKSGAHLTDPDAWAAANADDAHIVHVTHVFSNLALKTPVAEIVRRAREKGAVTIVDAAQSAGGVDVDAAGWGADFITGTSLKYLCGGAGAAFLWVNPDVAPRCAPADVGWFSHENPFEFDIRNFRYAPGAARFWGGTPSVAPYALARAGVAAIAAAGPKTVAAHNQALFSRIVAALPGEAFISHVAEGERGCSFIVAPKDIEAAAAALKDEATAFDRRMGGLRFSVHLYNDESDADRLIAILKNFL